MKHARDCGASTLSLQGTEDCALENARVEISSMLSRLTGDGSSEMPGKQSFRFRFRVSEPSGEKHEGL